MFKLFGSKKAKCPRCGREASIHQCETCKGAGKVQWKTPGQWSKRELKKNPYLPYYSSPRPKVYAAECKVCHGSGKILSCSTCGQFRVRL